MYFNEEETILVESAMTQMYFRSEGLLSEKPLEEILVRLGAFDIVLAECLLESNPPEDILKQIILETAQQVEKVSNELGKDSNLKLRWAENKEKVLAPIRDKYPEIFVPVLEEVKQTITTKNLISEIESVLKLLEHKATALLSNEEEAVQLENYVYKEISKLVYRESSSFFELTDERKKKILDFAEEHFLGFCNLVDKKLHEEPVCLLYYRTGNRVAVKVSLKTFGYRIGDGKKFRPNKGEDYFQYPYVVSVNYIDELLSVNDIRYEDVFVSPDSIEQFYSFDNEMSVNLTPSFVEKWWNFDQPCLYRHTPNKEQRGVNLLGIPFCHFSNLLVQSTFSNDYIDEDITEKEASALTTGYERTRLYKSMQNILEAKKIRENQDAVDKFENYVQDLDAKVQEVVNQNKDEILFCVAEKFPDRMISLNPFKINDDFGLDCGWVNVRPVDEEYNKARQVLHTLENQALWMNLELPFFTQSTTLKEIMVNKAKELVFQNLGIRLTHEVVLD